MRRIRRGRRERPEILVFLIVVITRCWSDAALKNIDDRKSNYELAQNRTTTVDDDDDDDDEFYVLWVFVHGAESNDTVHANTSAPTNGDNDVNALADFRDNESSSSPSIKLEACDFLDDWSSKYYLTPAPRTATSSTQARVYDKNCVITANRRCRATKSDGPAAAAAAANVTAPKLKSPCTIVRLSSDFTATFAVVFSESDDGGRVAGDAAESKCAVKKLSTSKLTAVAQRLVVDTNSVDVTLKEAFCVSCETDADAEPNCKADWLENEYRSDRGDTSSRPTSSAAAAAAAAMSLQFGQPGSIIIAILLDASIVCLSLHLFVFFKLAELRNLAGKNLAAFCVTLLAYYACCEVAVIFRGCRLAAILCHLVFVSCYAWMLVLSFDCWYGVRSATKYFRLRRSCNGVGVGDAKLRRRRDTKTFVSYCAVCWLGAPSTAVVAALYFRLAPEDTVSSYAMPMPSAAGGCSRMETKSLNVFVVAPAFALFVANVVLYAHSAYMICRHRLERRRRLHHHHHHVRLPAPAVTRDAAAMTLSPSKKNNLRVCLRLALLVNLCWMLQFLGALTDDRIVTFCYSVFTASQGTFVFFIFTWRERVLRSLRIAYADNELISSALSAIFGHTDGQRTRQIAETNVVDDNAATPPSA